VKFGFIAKHRGVWPAGWLCEALGVSRGGFYAWLTRPRSQRSRSDEELGAKSDALLHHSDRGSQYTSEQFQKLMEDHGMVCSMSRSGNVWDNAAMESFFSSLKTERVGRKIAPKTRRELMYSTTSSASTI
jgi:transposase InsO family protein